MPWRGYGPCYDLRRHRCPRHVVDETSGDLPGHYEVSIRSSEGQVIERYLTDKGRAELLRLMDSDQRTFTWIELERMSTPATIEDLIATMVAESGEGG